MFYLIYSYEDEDNSSVTSKEAFDDIKSLFQFVRNSDLFSGRDYRFIRHAYRLRYKVVACAWEGFSYSVNLDV